MKRQNDWNWMESIFRRIPIPYPITSLMIGLLIFVIYSIFIVIFDIKWDVYNTWQLSFLCILIVYLLAINQYTMIKMRIIFQRLEFISESERYTNELYAQLEKNIQSKFFYLLAAFIGLFPLIIVDLLRVFILHSVEHEDIFSYDPIFYAYNLFISFFAYYLLSMILWIIINVKLILDRMANEPYANLIKIDLFNADKIGGLGRIRDFIIKLNIYFSIGVSLAILAYVDRPSGYSQVVYDNIIILILFLLFGSILVFTALMSLKEIFKIKMNEELARIDEKHQKNYGRLLENISDQNQEKREDNLKFLSESLEVLHKERAERVNILDDLENRYSLKTVITASISFIMPLLALYEKLNDHGIKEILSDIFNLATDNATMFSLFLQFMSLFHLNLPF